MAFVPWAAIIGRDGGTRTPGILHGVRERKRPPTVATFSDKMTFHFEYYIVLSVYCIFPYWTCKRRACQSKWRSS